MTRHLSFRIVAAVTTITILLGIYTAKKWSPSETATDFWEYLLYVPGGSSPGFGFASNSLACSGFVRFTPLLCVLVKPVEHGREFK